MRYALLSDIHSNLEALETAVGHAENQHIDSWVVLGDTVGYGANPNECFEWVLQHADIYIVGNHEKAVVEPRFREWFNEWAREAIVWTDEVMTEKSKKEILSLPYLRIEKGMTFAHGSPDEPETFRYLFSFEDAVPSFKKMEGTICFVGHTHVPSCFCEGTKEAGYIPAGLYALRKGERYILNPGSVGQPRDRDPRLAFGIFDDEKQTFEVVRLAYANDKAADKIRKAGLPRYLADRLL
jgi:diadenosine tetraphosphatase ApaH/serine/threonine PP2A family protein phosphatase